MHSRRSVTGGLCLALGALGAGVARAARPTSYGKQLEITGTLGVGPAFDAVVDGRHLYVIAGGALHVADLTDPSKPKKIGSLQGLGHVRQIQVRNGMAYITAREDGFFLVDVSKPEAPRLVTHYDTIELATGLALAGDVAFIACRHAGVELIDIADARTPRHLSTLRVGEAQSLSSDGRYMDIGVWAARELVIADVRNPWRPVEVSRTPLTGYGDGVAIRGDLAYAATGHHSGGTETARPGPDDPGYGSGHGFEIFDVSNRAKPVRLSRVDFPKFYGLYMDTWRVRLSGDLAFVNDTYNGVFVLDVKDPQAPRVLAHRQLPVVPGIGDGDLPVEAKPGPAVGLGLTKDYMYIAGSWSDVHVVAAPGLAAPADPHIRVKLTAKGVADRGAGTAPGPLYQPGGQVYAVDVWKKNSPQEALLLVASGMAGLHVARLRGDRFEKLAAYPTKGFACSVGHHGDTVYVAEGMGGLGVYEADAGGRLREVSRYTVPGYSIQQVVITPAGDRALVHVGMNRLHVLDVSRKEAPVRLTEDLHPGLFYQRAIPTGLVADRFALVTWTVSGPFLFDLAPGQKPQFTGFQYPFRIGTENGATPDGEQWLVTTGGKYFQLTRGEKRPPKDVGLIGVEGLSLSGKPTLSGDTLFIANALTGRVTALDVENRTKPKVLASVMLPEHPGHIVALEGRALVPAGYQGLLLWDYRK